MGGRVLLLNKCSRIQPTPTDLSLIQCQTLTLAAFAKRCPSELLLQFPARTKGTEEECCLSRRCNSMSSPWPVSGRAAELRSRLLPQGQPTISMLPLVSGLCKYKFSSPYLNNVYSTKMQQPLSFARQGTAAADKLVNGASLISFLGLPEARSTTTEAPSRLIGEGRALRVPHFPSL